MQATIEREPISVTARRRAVVTTIMAESPRPYRAPLATFLALAAAGRASAAAPADQDLDAATALETLGRN